MIVYFFMKMIIYGIINIKKNNNYNNRILINYKKLINIKIKVINYLMNKNMKKQY